MADQLITVNNRPFFGRVEEQKQFRAVLNEMLYQPPHDTLPYICLLYGDGGIGKTTLAQRFFDIARSEFRDQFQTLWLDWEEERRLNASLQTGRENVSAEAIFDVLHKVAVKLGWGRYFKKYQGMVAVRADVEKKAIAELSSAGEHSTWADVPGATGAVLGKLVRVVEPRVGETGEKFVKVLTEVGVKVTAEQAARLHSAATERLRARLKPDQFNLFLNPHEQLAYALAEGLQQVAKRAPLLIFLDTYEIVDRADHWLREVIKAAGPQLMWVIAGRDNLLKVRQFDSQLISGYASDFSRRLLAYDMRELAKEDIRNYFSAGVPQRPLQAEDLEAISLATRGIPLAIREAADIWATELPLQEIVRDISDNTPSDQIVRTMTERYQMHCMNDDEDKRALYALALANGNIEVLRAMLKPADGAAFNLDGYLRRLERDYASVYRGQGQARLHDEPTVFFIEYLKDPVRRTEDWLRDLIQCAVNVLQQKLDKLDLELPLIEDRCDDEDWVQAVLDLTYYLFWLDEDQAWRWFMPRFVESLAYSRELRRGLLKVASNWESCLSKTGRKRLKALGAADE